MRRSGEAAAVHQRCSRLTLGKDVPLHDPNGRVAAGAIGRQSHEVPLEPRGPGVQDSPAFLQELFGVDGLQVLRVGGHQVLRVLGRRAAGECLGESTVQPAGAVSHGVHCGEGDMLTHSARPQDKAVSVHRSGGRCGHTKSIFLFLCILNENLKTSFKQPDVRKAWLLRDDLRAGSYWVIYSDPLLQEESAGLNPFLIGAGFL